MLIVKEVAHFFLMNHPHLTTLFLSTLLGEDALVFLAILSGKGIIPVWIILVFGLSGIFLGDFIYFLIGRTKKMKNYKKKITKSKFRLINEFIKRYGEKNILFSLILTKFVYGIRILMIFYLSSKGMKLKKYLFYNFIATLVWASILIPASWLLGKGFSIIFNITRDIKEILTLGLLLFLVYYLIEWAISQNLINRIKILLIKKRFN